MQSLRPFCIKVAATYAYGVGFFNDKMLTVEYVIISLNPGGKIGGKPVHGNATCSS